MAYTQGPLEIVGPSNGKQKSIDDGGDYAIIKEGFIIGEAIHLCGQLPSGVPVIADAEANARLWAAAPALLAVVEAVEWAGGSFVDECPSCIRLKPTHAPDCQLAAALRLERGER